MYLELAHIIDISIKQLKVLGFNLLYFTKIDFERDFEHFLTMVEIPYFSPKFAWFKNVKF